jgi:hypothetical protein
MVLCNDKVKYVCNTKVSNLRDPFAKVIVVVRNPYDTIWEAFMLVLNLVVLVWTL